MTDFVFGALNIFCSDWMQIVIQKYKMSEDVRRVTFTLSKQWCGPVLLVAAPRVFSNRADLAFRMRSQPRSRNCRNNGGSEDGAEPKHSGSKPAMYLTVDRGVNIMSAVPGSRLFRDE